MFCRRTSIFALSFACPAVFFAAANVFNFSQGANGLATDIAVFNLIYVIVITAVMPVVGPSWRQHGLFNTLRVTSYCALAISFILLCNGSALALFPGLAALFFGAGNFIQSSARLTTFRHDAGTSHATRAILHPAIWYGLGYGMTGIGIGGGMTLLANPTGNLIATLLTLIGILESAAALTLMACGRIRNQAIPFVGVAIGTLFFAATGLLTGNLLGLATGLCACAGELSLALLTHRQQREISLNS